jgi:hypothetical protein
LAGQASNLASEVITEPRNCSVSLRSQSSLRTPSFDSPIRLSMTASRDSDYGIEYYVGIAPITPETNMLADHCGLNRKLLICVMQLEKYQNIEQIAAPIPPPQLSFYR